MSMDIGELVHFHASTTARTRALPFGYAYRYRTGDLETTQETEKQGGSGLTNGSENFNCIRGMEERAAVMEQACKSFKESVDRKSGINLSRNVSEQKQTRTADLAKRNVIRVSRI